MTSSNLLTPGDSFSIDDAAATQATIDKHGLTFPVGHSADSDAVSQATGALVNADAGYIESTGFVIGPDGKVLVSVYSSNAIGRLVPDDVIGFIRYVREHERAAA